jgi:hypothetical protein
MLNGCRILNELRKVSGESSDTYAYQSGKIKNSSLAKGLKYYGMAIDKFLGNSLITRLMSSEFSDLNGLRSALRTDIAYGQGPWVDLSGLIAPEKALDDLLDAIERGALKDVSQLNHCFADLHSEYYNFEWKWAYETIQDYYKVNLSEADPQILSDMIRRWRKSVVGLDNLIYDDACKELELNGKTDFDSDPFVDSVREHIRVKTELAEKALAKLRF